MSYVIEIRLIFDDILKNATLCLFLDLMVFILVSVKIKNILVEFT